MRIIKDILPGNINTLLVFSLCTTLMLSAQQPFEHDSYKIRISADDKKKAIVESVIEVQDSLLSMSSIGAGQFPSRWASFVHNLKATTLEGTELHTEPLEGPRWRINSPDDSVIRLRYEVHLDHEDFEWSSGIDGAAYTREWGVFYTGRSLFVMSGDKEEILVSFELPQSWRVSTPWNSTGTRSHEYLVANHTALTEGMLFAGTHEEHIVKRDDFELIFAFGGDEVIKEKESFTGMAEGVLDYYIELMGGVPNPAPGNEFNKAIVVMNSYSQTDGEVIGNNISILMEKDGDEMSALIARFMFAHEFFHLWNGKSFSPVNNNCEWFKEGFTNYYTLKSLFHIGYLNEQSYLQVLNNFFYQRYVTDDGLGKLSMTDGDLKHDHWGLIYCGGFFAGISQDMIIRSSTGNQKNIDGVMKALFDKYGGTSEGYTLEELQYLMSQASGSDQAEFFNTYIKGSKRIPLDHYLRMGGFDAVEENGQITIQIKDNRSPVEEEINQGFFGMIKATKQ